MVRCSHVYGKFVKLDVSYQPSVVSKNWRLKSFKGESLDFKCKSFSVSVESKSVSIKALEKTNPPITG